MRTGGVIALCIVLLYGLEVLGTRGWPLPSLLVRGAWALEILFYVWAFHRVGPRTAALLTAVNSVTCAVCYLALIVLTSGPDISPRLYLVPVLPLIMALMQPQDPRAVIYSGATCTLGVLGLEWLRTEEPLRALHMAGLVTALSLLGAYGAARFREAQRALYEVRWERARRESLEQLALAEHQRAQTEKLATVGRLAADVMHEINNPLAFVHANVDYLSEELRARLPEHDWKELDEVLQETRVGLSRIEGIVSDLKGFSRMHAEEPVECVLVDVVSDAARLAAVRLKHVARVAVEVPADLRVFVTAGRLAQVVLNLLVNAGDALESARVREGQVWVRAQVDGARVTLLVEDNGPGFPAEVLPRVFDAFFTTKGVDKGTGLGLSISRELVERFGGSLRAENRPEGGARLRLELPLSVAAAA